MRKSRLSRSKQNRLIKHFVAGMTARTAASLVGVHRNTAAYYFLRLRESIACELEAEPFTMHEVPKRAVAHNNTPISQFGQKPAYCDIAIGRADPGMQPIAFIGQDRASMPAHPFCVSAPRCPILP